MLPMVDAHIHRLIVAGAHRRPIGIVSSTDLLAAVACAARKQR
jgi:CBS-domain-containing membrane protein